MINTIEEAKYLVQLLEVSEHEGDVEQQYEENNDSLAAQCDDQYDVDEIVSVGEDLIEEATVDLLHLSE